MQTYPYPTPDGIIDLVRKTEYDRLKWELEEQCAKLAKWQALAGQLAEVLWRCTTKGWFASDYAGEVIVALDAGKVRDALAAYESAKKGEQP